MPTPVGPAPRDPNDPDLWDWSGEDDDDETTAPRNPAMVALTVIVVAALVLALLAGAFL